MTNSALNHIRLTASSPVAGAVSSDRLGFATVRSVLGLGAAHTVMILGMFRNSHRVTRLAAPAAALLSLVLLAAGCSAGSFGGPSTAAAPTTTGTTASPPTTGTTASPPTTATTAPPPSSPPSFKDKIASFFSGASAKAPQPVANAPRSQPDVDCPLIDIREGASTLIIPPPNGQNNAMALKYQGTFVRAARECAIVNGQMSMKIGVQGRIIVGPAGGPGQVDVPLRIAIVDNSAAGTKTITTKLIRIPVAVASADQGGAFTHIEDAMTFPLPTEGSLDDYIVYIGFDPIGAEAQDKARPAAKAKPKLKPRPNPNAPTG